MVGVYDVPLAGAVSRPRTRRAGRPRGCVAEPQFRDGLGARAPVGDAVRGADDLAEVRGDTEHGAAVRRQPRPQPQHAVGIVSRGGLRPARRAATRIASPSRVFSRSGCTPRRSVRDRVPRRCRLRCRRRGRRDTGVAEGDEPGRAVVGGLQLGADARMVVGAVDRPGHGRSRSAPPAVDPRLRRHVGQVLGLVVVAQEALGQVAAVASRPRIRPCVLPKTLTVET